MPLSPAHNDYLTCAICLFPFCDQRRPISQSCGHTCCSACLTVSIVTIVLSYCDLTVFSIRSNCNDVHSIRPLLLQPCLRTRPYSVWSDLVLYPVSDAGETVTAIYLLLTDNITNQLSLLSKSWPNYLDRVTLMAYTYHVHWYASCRFWSNASSLIREAERKRSEPVDWSAKELCQRYWSGTRIRIVLARICGKLSVWEAASSWVLRCRRKFLN